MPVGFPAKTTYANGDVFSASDINDTNGTLNLVNPTNNFAAGKNYIINGDYRVNQRSFTSTTGDAVYGFDRWAITRGATVAPTVTYSAQTFTAGTAPVAGYGGTNFARVATTTGSSSDEYVIFYQHIEDIRSLGGKTVTVSFWAKAASGTPKVGVELEALSGTGGSGATSANGQSVTLSTSWARYSVTITNPSLTGVTIGANSSFRVNLWTSAGSTYNTRTGSIGNQTATIDFWGVQVENGSVTTGFQTATGSIEGELAACQRYYYRQTSSDLYGTYALGTAQSTTVAYVLISFPVTMRIVPNAVEVPSTLTNLKLTNIANANYTISAIGFEIGTNENNVLRIVASGMTANQGVWLGNNNSTSGFIGLSAEL
jgi:hypothetical protein